ncbi:hypothetical protein DKX38_025583 [Salix brachista]|uniref:Protein BZR1 homolog n=1 Tax=Salix brachista TaxID=2182728 RepID=A0A5N5JT42_9ROSI|nr:hypothetical protein DKX38_025583 [Salix brachista]
MEKDGSSLSSGRSESDKERTKLRERQRRAITTRIFHGLRKFGGYQLSRRSDINQVLRELAKEAGWVVEPDGTTYRYKVVSQCPTCGVIPNTSTNTTPTTSSTVIACGGGGDCSPTMSPRCNIGPVMINPYNNNSHAGPTTSLYGHEHGCADSCTGDVDNSNPLAFYMYNGPASGLHHPSTAAIAGGGMKVQIPSQRQLQGTYIQEAMASNQNTPVGSPSHLQRTN